MTELSPIAQTVMEEAWKAAMPPGAEHPVDAELIAAALRAVALSRICKWDEYIRQDILDIATELEQLP